MDINSDFGSRRSQNLRITTPSTPHQTSHLSERIAAQNSQRNKPSTPPVSEHASTPPISVTPTGGATVSRSDINVHGAFGRPRHLVGIEEGHVLEIGRDPTNGTGHRRKSISFAPNVRLDSGQQLPLQEPLPRDRNEQSSQDESNSAIALQIYGSSPPTRSRGIAFNGIRRGGGGFELYDNRSEDGDDSQSSRGGYGSSVGSPRQNDLDAISDGYDKERLMGSLTSASTASPMLDEVKTPPSTIDSYLSTPSGVERSNSLQEHAPAPWPWMNGGMTSAHRSKSFSVGKPRRTRAERKASCPTPNSPASQFLRGWKQSKAPSPDDEGQEIGDYIIGKSIGFGGYSEVKEAYTLEDGKKVCRAVKIVKKKVRDSEVENDAIQAEFEHEVNLWRHLSHRYILDLIKVYDTPYAFFCLTRYNIGGTLFDLVKRNRSGLEPQLVRRYSYQISSALRYLHQDMRVVHRDIKPENVLINFEEDPIGNVLLCDFGMAEFLPSSHNEDSDDEGYGSRRNRPPIKIRGPAGSSSAIAISSDSPIMGSLQYAAPELLKSDVPIIHPYVDMWAFGVTVYTITTGRLPFHHNLTGLLQDLIMKGEYDMDLLKTKVPLGERQKDLVEVLEGCINMDVDLRWDIEAVLESRWLEGLGETTP